MAELNGLVDLPTSNKNCCVPQCNSVQRKGISLHHFPKNKDRKKEWIVLLKIGKEVSATMSVCSRHFLESDFIPRAKGIIPKRRNLKKTARPSQCLPLRVHDRRVDNQKSVGREQRIARQRNRELCVPVNQQVCEEQSVNDPLPAACLHAEQPSTSLDVLAEICSQELENDQGTLHKYKIGSVIFKPTHNFLEDDLDDPLSVAVSTPKVFPEKSFNILSIVNNDVKLNSFTGIPSCFLFEKIVLCVEKIHSSMHMQFPLKGLILIVLVKLKLNLSFNILAMLFDIPPTSCKRYFQKLVFTLAKVFKTVILWQEKDIILKNMPKCFHSFKDVVLVLDCTEIPVESPRCLKCRILMYSHYKGGPTVKFLLGVSPAGLITFVSEAYGGRASDKFVTLDSGILEKLVPFRDAVMVDKGFYIDKECEDKFIKLVRPSFVKGGKPLSEAESIKSTAVARSRVHVERAIQRFKLFKLLNQKLDWYMLRYIDALKDIAVGIVNLTKPILADDKF